LKAHVITDDLHRITCPALALVGADEGERMLQQAQWFYEGISSKQKRLHVFSLERDGSSDHCQFDNLSRGAQVLYDWLDDVFDYRYPPINH
jgi:esterase/lipase